MRTSLAISFLIVLSIAFTVLSFQLDRLEKRLEKMETYSTLLLAGYKSAREIEEYKNEHHQP
jgi:hypothetical protein